METLAVKWGEGSTYGGSTEVNKNLLRKLTLQLEARRIARETVDPRAWREGVQQVLRDGVEDQIASMILANGKQPKTFAEVQDDITQRLEHHLDGSAASVMAKLRPLVHGFLKIADFGSSLASVDPHGVAFVAWGSVCLLLEAAECYYQFHDSMSTFLLEFTHQMSTLQNLNQAARSLDYDLAIYRVFKLHASFCVAVAAYLSNTWRHRTFSSGRGKIEHLIKETSQACLRAIELGKGISTDRTYDLLQHNVLAVLALVQRSNDNDFRAFLTWVGSVTLKTQHDIYTTADKERLPGTCSGIYSDPIVNTWLSSVTSDHRVLWITSGPGSGKTVLASHIFNELSSFEPRGVVPFWCTAQ